MPIKLGLKNINKIYLGNKQIKSVYLGHKKIFGSFKYDYEDPNEYDEIDLLYTTDIHGAWLEGDYMYQRDGWPEPKFAYKTSSTYASLQKYQSTLDSQGIKTLLIDGGDYTHCSGYDTRGEEPEINKSNGLVAVNRMNDLGYFAATIGNHEYKTGVDEEYGTEVIENVLRKFKGNSDECSIVACNLFDLSGNLVFKPYKTAKIGSKSIAVLGVACPGFDGDTEEWSAKYRLTDGSELYSLIQSYINFFKSNDFDYIVCLAHMGDSPDSRWEASWDELINSTSGLNIYCRSHTHANSNSSTKSDRGGNIVHLTAQPYCAFNYLTRIRLTSSGISSVKVQSY